MISADSFIDLAGLAALAMLLIGMVLVLWTAIRERVGVGLTCCGRGLLTGRPASILTHGAAIHRPDPTTP